MSEEFSSYWLNRKPAALIPIDPTPPPREAGPGAMFSRQLERLFLREAVSIRGSFDHLSALAVLIWNIGRKNVKGRLTPFAVVDSLSAIGWKGLEKGQPGHHRGAMRKRVLEALEAFQGVLFRHYPGGWRVIGYKNIIPVDLQIIDVRYNVEMKGLNSYKSILDEVISIIPDGKRKSIKQIAAELGLSETTVKGSLRRLIKAGKVERVRNMLIAKEFLFLINAIKYRNKLLSQDKIASRVLKRTSGSHYAVAVPASNYYRRVSHLKDTLEVQHTRSEVQPVTGQIMHRVLSIMPKYKRRYDLSEHFYDLDGVIFWNFNSNYTLEAYVAAHIMQA